MSGFQYFIPAQSNDSLRYKLRLTNLSPYIDKIGSVGYCQFEGGGYLFTIKGKSNGVSIGIREDQIIEDCDGYKIIIEKNDPPKPEDFIKDNLISGYEVELGDGNKWLLPIARKLNQGSQLPSTMHYISEGRYELQPMEEYLPLSEIAEKVEEDLMVVFGMSDNELNYSSLPTIYEACFKIISTNYNLSATEISLLKLVTTTNFQEITRALIDWELIRSEILNHFEKKTQNLLKEYLY
ncbi:MAG: hypothetical protein COA79_21000 [Planctomycetota bacterium]|nr:MAG: hypothetical protein COA79_21000 [Planctomycetota bacterium]